MDRSCTLILSAIRRPEFDALAQAIENGGLNDEVRVYGSASALWNHGGPVEADKHFTQFMTKCGIHR